MAGMTSASYCLHRLVLVLTGTVGGPLGMEFIGIHMGGLTIPYQAVATVRQISFLFNAHTVGGIWYRQGGGSYMASKGTAAGFVTGTHTIAVITITTFLEVIACTGSGVLCFIAKSAAVRCRGTV